MATTLPILLDIEIDKLTNSIENVVTGEVFETEIIRLTMQDLKLIKKKSWQFDWKKEVQNESRQVYKLTTINNSTVVHGLISISDNHDHVYMHLVENALFNKGKEKLYRGVAGNLVAFACKMSFLINYDGVVAFVSKTSLVEHYKQTLGAKQFSGNRMFIDTSEAARLVQQYFKNFRHGQP